MNTKYFVIGFTAMDSVITGVLAAKRVVSTKNGVLAASEAAASFLAGAKQAIKYRKELRNISRRPMLSNVDGDHVY